MPLLFEALILLTSAATDENSPPRAARHGEPLARCNLTGGQFCRSQRSTGFRADTLLLKYYLSARRFCINRILFRPLPLRPYRFGVLKGHHHLSPVSPDEYLLITLAPLLKS